MRIAADGLLNNYKVVAKVQEQVAFEKAHLPHENEGWAMKALEGAVHMALRFQAAKYQANMMHLEILQDPPAVRCNRAFKAGDLVMHLLPQPRGPPTSRCSAAQDSEAHPAVATTAPEDIFGTLRGLDRGCGRISAASTRVSTGCIADSISLGEVGGYEFFLSSQFAAAGEAELRRNWVPFVSHFWVVARDSEGANMEMRLESESFSKGANKVKVAVPQMFNTVALAKGDFLQVAPWPRLQPRPAKKMRLG